VVNLEYERYKLCSQNMKCLPPDPYIHETMMIALKQCERVSELIRITECLYNEGILK